MQEYVHGREGVLDEHAIYALVDPNLQGIDAVCGLVGEVTLEDVRVD